MSPNEIRARILAEHADLKKRLAGVEFLAARVLAGQSGAVSLLRARVKQLVVSLWAHLGAEDELLLPAIRDVDAWGSIRAERLEQEHQAQRAAIDRLKELSLNGDCLVLAQSVQRLSTALLEDISREEGELLNPDLLRDDIVTIGQFLG